MDPAFQHKCHYCQAVGEGFLARHLCVKCGMPQPLSSEKDDYFSIFGLPMKFGFDRADLQKRFYELSRALHPDRFTTSQSSAREHSLTRMSWVNQAYSVLKDPQSLREYVLSREGLKTEHKGAVPMDLAESWFEIQDLLSEGDPEAAQRKLSDFEGELAQFKAKTEKQLSSAEAEFDLHVSRGQSARSTLERMAQDVQALNYLKSLGRDVERIKRNAHSN